MLYITLGEKNTCMKQVIKHFIGILNVAIGSGKIDKIGRGSFCPQFHLIQVRCVV